jgi:hypothetical protein
MLLTYPVIGQRLKEERHGGCNGDKNDKKESQKQSQGHAQKTDWRQSRAQKDRNEPKKGNKKDGDKGAPPVNS